MSEKKGLMSCKVLNMKFMKVAEVKEEEKKVEEQVKKLKDLSEWKTKGAEALKAKTRAKPKVVSVGYTNINLLNKLDAPTVGRRVFGEEPKKKEQETSTEDQENEIDRAFRLEKEDRDKYTKGSTKRYMDQEIPNNKKKRKPLD